MKSLKIIIVFLFIGLTINSCHQESPDYLSEDIQKLTEDADDNVLSSTAATYQDDSRKFVRKADVSIEVENVYRSTTNIERKLSNLNGFVEKSELDSRVNSRQTFPVNADSAIEVKRYTVNNYMTVRLPHENMNEFLLSLGEEMVFLNHRNISAEDIGLTLEWAKLEQNRLNQSNDELKDLNNQKGKINDKKDVIQTAADNKLAANHQKIKSLELDDQVNFSSIQIQIREKEKIAETMVFNSKTYTDKYRPDFFYSLGKSLQGGFYLLQTLLLGLLYIWPLWIIAILIFIMVKSLKKRSQPQV